MYYKLNDKELKVIQQASKITSTDYELINEFIPTDSFMSLVEDLLLEISNLKEEKQDLENDIRDNYKPIPASEMYGISDKDFI